MVDYGGCGGMSGIVAAGQGSRVLLITRGRVTGVFSHTPREKSRGFFFTEGDGDDEY
jgi:hypothetical protein